MTETKTKTATFIKRLHDFTGDARLFRLSEPIVQTDWDDNEKNSFEYVVVSATVASYSGPETYIFGANEAGEIQDWLELEGSYRGGLDHDEALSNAGYEIRASSPSNVKGMS